MKAKITSSASSNPDAWIVINNQKDESKPSDRGRKSVKKGKVYLSDKQEFEIELYNPLKECVLCDIKLNGKSISQSGLVLKPGQRFYLDCFLDDKKKFVFNTYDIEDTSESKEAISNNGLLEVFFYKEEVVNFNNWKDRFNKVIIEKWYPYQPYYQPYTNPYWYTTGTITTNTNSCITSLTTTSNNVYNTSNVYLNSTYETGRVEKGNESSQSFSEIDMDFENYYVYHKVIQILPESRKPIDVKDLNKKNKKKPSIDVISLIKKLGELHSDGILTDEEFTSKKSELLSKI
jgi:hypothetical protein